MPVSAGNYFWSGEYNGKAYYRRTDLAMFIWWEPLDNWWAMTPTLGSYGTGYWHSPTTAITGLYLPVGSYSGNPNVSAM